MTTPEQGSVINSAVYHFDLHAVRGDPTDLAAAAAFMAEYRRLGGEEYRNMERCIRSSVDVAVQNGADICSVCDGVFPPKTLADITETEFELICAVCVLKRSPTKPICQTSDTSSSAIPVPPHL